MTFEMPHRQPGDPEPSTFMCRRVGEHHLVIEGASPAGTTLRMSEWTAARLVGVLSLFLQIRLHKADAKQIVYENRPPGATKDHADYLLVNIMRACRGRGLFPSIHPFGEVPADLDSVVMYAALRFGNIALAEEADKDG